MLRRRKKPKGPKKVNYRIIDRESGQGAVMYSMLRDLVDQHREDIAQARILLAWHLGWKPDVDGVPHLVDTKKASDLDRELAPYDFIILLNESWWNSKAISDDARRAVLHHGLCYPAPKLDDRTGEQVIDDRGRPVWRKRKPPIREFPEVVEHHASYTHHHELYAQALLRSRPQRIKAAAERAQQHIAGCEDCGGTSFIDAIVEGVKQAKRCHCFDEARELTAQAEATL